MTVMGPCRQTPSAVMIFQPREMKQSQNTDWWLPEYRSTALKGKAHSEWSDKASSCSLAATLVLTNRLNISFALDYTSCCTAIRLRNDIWLPLITAAFLIRVKFDVRLSRPNKFRESTSPVVPLPMRTHPVLCVESARK